MLVCFLGDCTPPPTRYHFGGAKKQKREKGRFSDGGARVGRLYDVRSAPDASFFRMVRAPFDSSGDLTAAFVNSLFVIFTEADA
jgi:hypothetical protein